MDCLIRLRQYLLLVFDEGVEREVDPNEKRVKSMSRVTHYFILVKNIHAFLPSPSLIGRIETTD